MPFPKSEIEQLVSQRFEAQACLHAERVAVCAGGQTLRYRELNQWANRVASALSGAGEARPILVCVGQRVAMPAAILGVLKAGHFYVPVSDGAPLKKILAHAGARTILCDRASRAAASAVADAATEIIDVEDDRGLAPEISATGTPDSLAYIYYTSGSTGAAKGVCDSHRNVLHNIWRYTSTLNITEADRLTLLQTPGFSGAVSSLFCALLNGAASYPLDPGLATPARLAQWVQEHQLTMWHSVPSLFRQLCASGERFDSIRVVRLEGDQAAASDVALFRRHFRADCLLVNGLGTTETGLCRRYVVPAEFSVTAATLPIGYPVEDMEVSLLDVEDGVGEIAVKSRYLALGYWQQPELTAQRFLSCGDGQRLYRTGDLGRLASDSCLEHLGRADFAVKIAGQRVEIQEVEAALAQLDGVQQAAVAARRDACGELRLVAYLVTNNGVRPTALRRMLQAHVPAHAIPARFVRLDALPLNAFGKLDRRTLPELAEADLLSEAVTAPPETEAEKAVATVWREILGLAEVGIDDDFSVLGGSSLEVTRMLAELNLPVEAWLRSPTIRTLARELTAHNGASSLIVLLAAGRGDRPLFCVPPHSGVLLGYRSLAAHLSGACSVYGFCPPAQQVYSIGELAALYLQAMRSVQSGGPYRISGHCFGGWVALEMARQLREQGDAAELLLLLECYPPDYGSRGRAGRIARRILSGPTQWRALLARWRELRALARRIRLAQASHAEGTSLPDEMRTPEWYSRIAAHKFRPRPYSGRVVLFEANGSSEPMMGWSGMLDPATEVHTIATDQRGMMTEDATGELAQRLAPLLR